MAKRIFQAVVLFFALYAFVFLPLGKKSALEHLRAIWATPAAQQAASEVKGGVTKLVRRLESEARKSSAGAERGLGHDGERDGDSNDADGDTAQRDTSGRRAAEKKPAERGTAERKAAERMAAERMAAERDSLERNIDERMEAEAPRSTQKARLRALSADVPARDGL